jgi:lipoprotein-anchoring transpeptidase ErfK/SrfK
MRAGGHMASAISGLWRVAVLSAAGAIGTASDAEAGLYYWPDFDPGYYRPASTFLQQRQPKPRRHQIIRIQSRGSAKPQGPLIIAISIGKQNLKIYDANGFFAETPISTGMSGYPTPLGVFSVIQKHKLHHSNIYSGAPMPYMQRITWSGIAIHAGVLPGYPASHGCIRMPIAFAMKMWNWTRMGARVVVTPGEMTPASFSHPLLATRKVVAQPTSAREPQPDAPTAAMDDKAANADVISRPMISKASLQLRSTIGHNDDATPAMDQSLASAPLHEPTHTADPSGDLRATQASVTRSDATPNAGSEPPRDEAAMPPVTPPSIAASGAEPFEAELVRAKSSGTAIAETKTVETDASDEGAKKSDANNKTVADISPSAPDAKEDQARLPETEKPAITIAPKRTGQIAVFISRKDSKLYVRQNFAPLFDMPIAIAASDRPLGTHIFTARADKEDVNVLHWSVVSLPVRAGYAERRDEDERVSRRRKIAGAVEMKALPLPNSATEALDRLTIPADAMAQITEALSTGSSIIVSDQGITAGETGEGTDFIVSLR